MLLTRNHRQRETYSSTFVSQHVRPFLHSNERLPPTSVESKIDTVALRLSTVVSPYVGMARKQNGGYNASISVQTLIFHLVVNSTHLKTVRSALWRCPNSTVALRLLENVVTNQVVVKIEFCHLPFLLLLSSSPASLAP